ncbi:hypothetical protein FIV32_02245 [Sphingomonadales bacterium 58]|uniref:hypothetical protein n=1 Tax=Sphingobium sp. S8 TaxID=2758385 RepID=UPI001918B4F8|nr:hypothetical protein [Sphingobium sp. S8]MBY2957570.1 hypothetical protein [Sphingomonadales bacterium 58]CAD7335345.1 hypothetical protein SPHS8_00461 [Sphingobium sp. S8]
MTTATSDGTAAIAILAAMLKELDARDPGFASAVFRRVEADITLHEGIPAYQGALEDALELIRPEVQRANITG